MVSFAAESVSLTEPNLAVGSILPAHNNLIRTSVRPGTKRPDDHELTVPPPTYLVYTVLALRIPIILYFSIYMMSPFPFCFFHVGRTWTDGLWMDSGLTILIYVLEQPLVVHTEWKDATSPLWQLA